MCTLLIISSLILLLAVIICVRECKKENFIYNPPDIYTKNESCSQMGRQPVDGIPETSCISGSGFVWSIPDQKCCY